MSYDNAIKNQSYIFYIGLISQSTGQLQSNPTLAAGDFKVSIDGGTFNNLGTLPVVSPATSKNVKVTLANTEMNGDNIVIIGSDAAGAEWNDVFVAIQTSTSWNTDGTVLADLKQIDEQATNGNNATLKLKALDIVNDSGNAVHLASSAQNTDVVLLEQLNSTVGGGGSGIYIVNNQPLGSGIYIDASAADSGIAVFANGDALGVVSVGAGKSILAQQDIAVSDGNLTLGAIADAAWDETLAGHLTAGSTGAALNAAGAAGDPWSTMIPGAYGAGTAGYIIGNNLDAKSSTLGTLTGQQRIEDFIEFNRGHHTVSGNTFYVDGVGGNDTTGNGSRTAPYKTISKALTVCVSNNHDLIILLPNSGGGPTTITETATISVAKNYVQIRGPGRDVNVTQTAGANRDVFSITASGVELSGFRVTTNGASSNGVTVSGAVDFVRLYRLWIENAHQDAVLFNVANRCEVAYCTIVAPGRDGVRVSSGAGSGNYNLVLDSIIRDSVGSAVNLQGTDASDCRIQRNVIRDNAVGVTIAVGAADTVLTDNRFINNTVEISDSGTRTLQQWNYLYSGTDGRVDVALIEGLDATNQIRDSILTDATRFAGANIDAAITSRLAPTVAARTLDVTATGAAGVDWGNVENQATTVNLSDTTIKSVTNRVTANTDQIEGVDATDQIDARVQASLTAQGYTTTRAGYLDTLNNLVANIWGAATRTLTAFGFSVTVGTNNDKTGYTLDAAYDPAKTAAQAGDAMTLTTGEEDTIVDKVWDELIAGHLGAGSTGAALNGAGSAGDPWSTPIPGAYGPGTAGNLVGTNLDAKVSDVPTDVENADALLNRDMSAGVDTNARSVRNALRKLRNKVSFNGVNTLTVTKEDDATPAYTQAIATDAAQEPFKSVG